MIRRLPFFFLAVLLVFLPVTPVLAAIGVSTDSATDISASTATLNGTIDGMEDYISANVWFEYGLNTSYGSTTAQQVVMENGTFSAVITGLTQGQTYHFRAVAQPVGETPSYGIDRLFATGDEDSPEVATGSATYPTVGSVTLSGSLVSMGSHSSVQAWFEWGTTTSYGSSTTTQNLTATGEFTADISGIIVSGDYHFRAVVSPDNGVTKIYGDDNAFSSTEAGLLQVATDTATDVTGTSATLVGELVALSGQSKPAQVYFELGGGIAYGNETAKKSMASPGLFNVIITGLQEGATYHYRAVAVDLATGTVVHGSDSAFTTLAGASPKLNTGSASNVTATSAAISGSLTSMGSSSEMQVSFEWGTGTGYGSATQSQTLTAPGTFSTQVTGLTAGTNYHYRAVARNAGGVVIYGADATFATSTVPTPTPTAAPPTTVPQTTAPPSSGPTPTSSPASTTHEGLNNSYLLVTVIAVVVFMLLALLIKLLTQK